jgi:integrase
MPRTHLEAFFTTRLIRSGRRQPAHHRRLPRHVAAAAALRRRHHRHPAHTIDIAQLDADLIGAFLTHLQDERGNSIATRNARLAAVHSLFAYAAVQHPNTPDRSRESLAIPAKRRQRRTDITYLTEPEVTALLTAPDQCTVAGRRDHALIQVAVTTGLRVSELTGLRRRRPPRHRRPRPGPRQRPQGPHHPAGPPDRDRPTRPPHRTSGRHPRHPARGSCHHPHRHPDEPRRRRGAPHPARATAATPART